jgi:hypothetical protein
LPLPPPPPQFAASALNAEERRKTKTSSFAMKSCLLLALWLPHVAVAIENLRAPSTPEEIHYTYRTEYFHQRVTVLPLSDHNNYFFLFLPQVDHFGFANSDFYQQRYLINDTYWDAKESGSIFFYAGNEGDIEAFAQNSVC